MGSAMCWIRVFDNNGRGELAISLAMLEWNMGSMNLTFQGSRIVVGLSLPSLP